MADKVYVGRKCQSFQSFGEYEPFTGVKLWRDDDTYFFAGDDTGRVMEVTHRSAKQSMADNILDGIKGFVYKPFEAKGCELDPAAELGDAVTICGIYTMIGSMRKNFKNGGLVDIGLPGGKEINHEYPYKSPQDRELKRRVKLGQNYFGTKITHKDGLVIENIDDKTNEVLATAVLNANILAFYKGQSRREEDAQLYFDPAEGIFKFRGAINVNDMFTVDKNGNVVIKSGSISWDTVIGTEELDGRIENAQSTASGAASSASSAANDVLKLAKGTFTRGTFINGTTVSAPQIIGGKIYGTEMYAGQGSSTFVRIGEEGLRVFKDDVQKSKVMIGVDPYGTTPQIQLGSGDGTGKNMFYILKSATKAQILYHSINNNISGFEFRDGEIEPIGDLKVTATFA